MYRNWLFGGRNWIFDTPPDGIPDGGQHQQAGGGGGGNPPANPPVNPPPTGGLIEVKVGGETRRMTQEEVVAAAQKSLGADQRFQEASNIRKSAETAMGFMKAFNVAMGKEEGDIDEAQATICNTLGISMEDLMQQQGQPAPKGGSGGGSGQEPAAPARKIGLEDVDPRLKNAALAAEKAELAEIRQNIEKNTMSAIDNDKEIAKMLDGQTESRKAEIRQALYDIANDDVRNRILSGSEAFGADMLQTVVQKVRGVVTRIGIPVTKQDVPPVLGTIFREQGLTPEVLSDKPIERVQSTDQRYEDNVVQRALQRQRKAMAQSR